MHKTLDFRSYEDTNIEVMYFHFFPEQTDFPYVIGTEYFDEKIVDYFKKNKGFIEICEDIYTSINISRIRPITTGDEIDSYLESENSNGHIAFFKRKDNPHKLPLLIKLRKSNEGGYIVYIASKDVPAIHKLIAELKKKFLCEKDYDKETYFGILYRDNYGVKVKQYPLNDEYIKELDVKLNYGSAFVDVDKIIVEKLKKNGSGIVLLHGPPNVGKTSYIKYLSHQIGKKSPFIFIPTSYIDELISPNLLPLLLKHKNSILVLEDAEKAIISREQQTGNESIVSALLNLGDGILGSMLQIKIIITFNTAQEKIDEAILRKNRLLYEYKFEPLSILDSQNLINKLHKNYTVKEPMTLGDIYGLEIETGHTKVTKSENKIGFQPC